MAGPPVKSGKVWLRNGRFWSRQWGPLYHWQPPKVIRFGSAALPESDSRYSQCRQDGSPVPGPRERKPRSDHPGDDQAGDDDYPAEACVRVHDRINLQNATI